METEVQKNERELKYLMIGLGEIGIGLGLEEKSWE